MITLSKGTKIYYVGNSTEQTGIYCLNPGEGLLSIAYQINNILTDKIYSLSEFETTKDMTTELVISNISSQYPSFINSKLDQIVPGVYKWGTIFNKLKTNVTTKITLSGFNLVEISDNYVNLKANYVINIRKIAKVLIYRLSIGWSIEKLNKTFKSDLQKLLDLKLIEENLLYSTTEQKQKAIGSLKFQSPVFMSLSSPIDIKQQSLDKLGQKKEKYSRPSIVISEIELFAAHEFLKWIEPLLKILGVRMELPNTGRDDYEIFINGYQITTDWKHLEIDTLIDFDDALEQDNLQLRIIAIPVDKSSFTYKLSLEKMR